MFTLGLNYTFYFLSALYQRIYTLLFKGSYKCLLKFEDMEYKLLRASYHLLLTNILKARVLTYKIMSNLRCAPMKKTL